MSNTMPQKRRASTSLPPPSNHPKSQKTSSSSSRSPAKAAGGPSTAKLEEQLSLFTRSRLQNLLVKVAKEHPVVAAAIEKEVLVIRKVMAQAPAIDFQAYSSSVWHLLNTKYARLRPSQQFEVVGDVAAGIEQAVNEGILAKVTKDVCYGTKYNALSVLRKIAKSILLTEPGEIAKGVENDGTLGVVADAMKKVVGMMDGEERKKVLWSEENLVEKLEELDELRDSYGGFAGNFGDVWGGNEDGDEDGRDDENGHEEEEEASDEGLFVPESRPVATGGAAAVPKRMEVIDLTS